MINLSHCICPICSSPHYKTIFTLNCGNLDKSRLYPTIRVNHCISCGHFFNDLTADELDGLTYYYNHEYAPANLSATDDTGDRPGSTSNLTTQRYDQLYKALSPHINSQHDVLDVGCALGSFLNYLHSKNYTRLFGVDMSERYVEKARLNNKHHYEIGNADSLPFDDQQFNLIVMEQVLEHLFNPAKAFEEARRTLKSGGIFCIGVPDAARYLDFYFFDFYWLLLREHIQHFDIAHLALLAKLTGFDLLAYYETVHFIMTENMKMPNLYAIFKLTDSNHQGLISDFDNFNLKRLMNSYLLQEKEKQLIKCQQINVLIQSQRPVYVWGIGREFLYLYESAGLNRCNLAGLIDVNPFKQASSTVRGMKIFRGDKLLSNAPVESALLITAIAHTHAVKNAAEAFGFKGDIIDLS